MPLAGCSSCEWDPCRTCILSGRLSASGVWARATRSRRPCTRHPGAPDGLGCTSQSPGRTPHACAAAALGGATVLGPSALAACRVGWCTVRQRTHDDR
eukprot:845793-Prymnesium_polylepis.4